MLDSINVGIPIIGGKGWLGGVSYIELLVKAVTSLPQESRPKLYLVVAMELLPELALHNSIIPLCNGVIFVGNAQVELPDNVIRIDSYNSLFKAIDFYYPVLFDVWPGLPAASWIPDFQHLHLPGFFPADEIERRSTALASIRAKAHFLVFSSNDALRDYHYFCPRSDAITRVLNFYALPQESWYADNFDEVRKRYDLPDAFLICCNQFWAHKNHSCLFEAIAALHSQKIDLHLVCTGSTTDFRSPDYFDRLTSLIRSLGIEHLVHIVGNIPRDDQLQLVRKAMAVVQPSLFEGWSTVVEDCRALGKTIILSDLAVHREQAPRHGVYFDRTSSESLAQVIRNMLPELRPGPDPVRESQARSEAFVLAEEFGRRFCSIVQEYLILPFGMAGYGAASGSHTAAFPESRLAHKWLDGLKGLEIGPSAHNPFGLDTRNVGLDLGGYTREQHDLVGSASRLHIIAPADDIPVPDDSEDFVLSSHVIEHCPDMIKTLVEWYRVIKPGGYLYMVIPYRDAAPSDKGRPLTEWGHFVEDYINGITEREEPEANGIPFGYGHYHVFELDAMYDYMRKIFGERLELVDHLDKDDKVGNGFTLVYRKKRSFERSFPWSLHDCPQKIDVHRSYADKQRIMLSARILMAANLVPFSDLSQRQRQDVCVASINGLSDKNIIQLNICYPDEALMPPGWHIAPVLQRSADAELKTEGKRKPFVPDLFDTAAEWAERHNIEHFVVTNSDIIVTDRLIAEIRNCLREGYETIAVSRNEIERIDPVQGIIPGYLEINGYDIFVCRTAWWQGNRHRFQQYIYGERAWDNAYAAIMACHSQFAMLCTDGLCFHFKHQTSWLDGCYADYNMGLYSGADRPYRDMYEAFVKHVIAVDKKDLDAATINALLQKYFTPMVPVQKASSAGAQKYVNIGMVTFNRLEFTRRAIAALTEHTGFPYVLTVIDNNSQDGTKEYLRDLKKRGIIKNLVLLDLNVGVAKASNLAWNLEQDAPYYLKLDNDIVIQKNCWLDDMVRILDEIPQLAAIAYNFEPRSYPVATVSGHSVRITTGNLGGACFLIPKRTHEKLGDWCEDYGLYSEEDYDYCYRMSVSGMSYAYMEDENVGVHLPAGKAAVIDDSFNANDGIEEVEHEEYRRWKDAVRREVCKTGLREHNIRKYNNDFSALYVVSGEFAKWQKSGKHGLTGDVAKEEQAPTPLGVAIYSIVFFKEACGYYRIYSPFKELNGAVVSNEGCRIEGKAVRINQDAAISGEVILVQRSLPQTGNADVLEWLFSLDKPIIFELDDLLTQIPFSNPHHDWGARCTPDVIRLLENSTAVTVSTEELKKHFASYNKNIHVLPNMLDTALWDKMPPSSSGPLVIGYAGTETHIADLELLEDALERISEKYGTTVSFVFMGCATERIARLPGFRFVPFEVTYEKYARELQNIPVDIMLAPLEDNPFNRCKSNVKWLEYSACGFAGIYSDLPPYDASVEHGSTGLLVGDTTQQWYAAISLLIDNKVLRKSIAANARAKVLSEYSAANNAWRWLDVYKKVVAGYQGRSRHLSGSAMRGGNISVSIIIPFFNNMELSRRCLESLRSATSMDICEIVLVDNGSTDNTCQLLEHQPPQTKIIRNDNNRGFAVACNQGAAEACGEYLVFLNNDTEPQPGWLDALMRAVKLEKADIAGSKLLYPDGSVQHAGIAFAHDNMPFHIYKRWPADSRPANSRRWMKAVTGACMLVSKGLFMEMGGFDEGYRNGFEDIDFCLRSGMSGKRILYVPESVVIHHEESTPGRKTHDPENMARFFSKWGGADLQDDDEWYCQEGIRQIVGRDGSIHLETTDAHRI